MYYDEEFNSDTLLRENVDFYLKRAHNENMLYKVKEILCEAYNHDIICLSRLTLIPQHFDLTLFISS